MASPVLPRWRWTWACFLALLPAACGPPGPRRIGYALRDCRALADFQPHGVYREVAESGAARTRQKALFVVSALIGLAITTAIVWAGDTAGLDPRLAKLVAVAVSFIVTWLLRSRVVFRQG